MSADAPQVAVIIAIKAARRLLFFGLKALQAGRSGLDWLVSKWWVRQSLTTKLVIAAILYAHGLEVMADSLQRNSCALLRSASP